MTAGSRCCGVSCMILCRCCVGVSCVVLAVAACSCCWLIWNMMSDTRCVPLSVGLVRNTSCVSHVVVCRDSGMPNMLGLERRNPIVSISRYWLNRGSDGCDCLGCGSACPVVGSCQCKVIAYGRYLNVGSCVSCWSAAAVVAVLLLLCCIFWCRCRNGCRHW